MAELWLPSAGANRKQKQLWLPNGGVSRKLKELYVGVGGVNRKVFSGADATVTSIVVDLWSPNDLYTVTIGEDGSFYISFNRYPPGKPTWLNYSAEITFQTTEPLTWAKGAVVFHVDNLRLCSTDGSGYDQMKGVSPSTPSVDVEYSLANYSLTSYYAGIGNTFKLKISTALRSPVITAGYVNMSWPAGALQLAGKTISNIENKATIQVVQHVYESD